MVCCMQVMKYVFSGQPELRQKCEQLLRVQPGSVTPEQLLDEMLQQVTDSGAPEGGPPSMQFVGSSTVLWVPSPFVLHVCANPWSP